AFTQTSSPATGGRLKGSTGSLYLEGKLKSGTLKLDVEDFVDGYDRALIARGTFNSQILYRSMFCYNHDRQVLARLGDDDHSTTLLLSDSDNPEIGYLTVWNDTAPPQNFRINKKRFMETLNQKDSIEGDASGFDVVGRRKPPNFTSDELEMVFGK